ncbi:MAG: LysM peptidoglycan-binding domain-containing protein [Planctomycetes bacterium]|nr:LysM peptidoglycan-binding domain-containing protein [Planctomycetota bacterium]
MRSLATLGGILVLVVLAIAWKISNQVEAGQEPDKNTGRVTLGVSESANEQLSRSEGESKGTALPTTGDVNGASGIDPELSASTNPTPAPEEGSGANQPSTPPIEETPVQSKPTAEEKVASIRYTVQEGDTLYRILMNAYGKANDTLIDAVAVASNLDDPSRLRPGMELVLPEVPGYDSPKKP